MFRGAGAGAVGLGVRGGTWRYSLIVCCCSIDRLSNPS